MSSVTGTVFGVEDIGWGEADLSGAAGQLICVWCRGRPVFVREAKQIGEYACGLRALGASANIVKQKCSDPW